MILGIDYGLNHCGLAISEGSLAEPWKTVATKGILQEIKKIKPERIVVGISERVMAKRTLRFAERLRVEVGCVVEVVDETLTSWEAAKISGRDKQKHHAVAAALILQRYLDTIKM